MIPANALDNHCGVRNCPCTHTHGCERGWIFVEYYDEKIVKTKAGLTDTIKIKYDGVTPCPMCSPDRYEIYKTSKTSWEYHERLRGLSNHNRQSTYENEERERTRTL